MLSFKLITPQMLILLAIFIFHVKSIFGLKATTGAEVRAILDEIDNDHYKLRHLLDDFFNVQPNTRTEDNGNDCTCVPFYLCNNGEIVRDGRRLLEHRAGINPCRTIGDICCEPYYINQTTQDTDDFECGHIEIIPTNRTNQVDKTVAKFGEFPWTAIILSSTYKYECVGSLIHPQVILTAAHCINNSEAYIVRVGEWDTSSKIEPYLHQNSNVKSIIKHPDFNIDNLFYNVALLILEKPFQLSKNVRTVCLPNDTPKSLKNSFDKCAASGWGMDKPKTIYKRVMKKVNYALMLHHQCQNELRETRLGIWFELHETFLCAMGQYGHDLCTGDGGGPLVCSIHGVQNRFEQVGITSWGIGCDAKNPSVFTKVFQIKDWIDKQFSSLNFNKRYYTFTLRP